MNSFEKNKQEIIYHLINSFLAGILVFLGSLSAGEISLRSCGIALVASLIVLFTKFKEYWTTQEKEYHFSGWLIAGASLNFINANTFKFLKGGI